MWCCAILVALAVSIFAEDLHPLSDEFISKINNAQSTWTAGRNFDKDTPMSHIRGLLGALPRIRESILPSKDFLPKFIFQKTLMLEKNGRIVNQLDTLGTNPHVDHVGYRNLNSWIKVFNAAGNNKDIQDIRVNNIKLMCIPVSTGFEKYRLRTTDAFGAVEAISDRVCIHSNGKKQVSVSAEDLLTCCTDCGDGCNGGIPELAWQYWQDEGIVTGGDYGTKNGCKAYAFPPCEHHVNGSLPACGPIKPTPPCKNTCDSSGLSYQNSRTFGKSIYTLLNEDAMKRDIYENGPVEAVFDVYEDFLAYKTGVYRQTTGRKIAGHAIKILGWGDENDKPYWLAANSWNADWGNKGFFKILRGKDECGIESDVVAGVPQL